MTTQAQNTTEQEASRRRIRFEMTKKPCVNPDGEGGIIRSEHNFGKDGLCCTCGAPLRLRLVDNRRNKQACYSLADEETSVIVADVYRFDIAPFLAKGPDHSRTELLEVCKGLVAELRHGQNVPSLGIMQMMKDAIAKAERRAE